MGPIELIRYCDDVEVPAVGRWVIPGGQRVDGSEPRRVRSTCIALRTRGGLLCSSPLTPTLRLSLVLERVGGKPAPQSWAFSGPLVAADRFGWWRFDGTLMTGDEQAPPGRLIARYHGVFDRGARPVAWLSIIGVVTPRSRRRILAWRRQVPSLIDFRGDLNAELWPDETHVPAPLGQAPAPTAATDDLEHQPTRR